jgi:hypothetical protein
MYWRVHKVVIKVVIFILSSTLHTKDIQSKRIYNQNVWAKNWKPFSNKVFDDFFMKSKLINQVQPSSKLEILKLKDYKEFLRN